MRRLNPQEVPAGQTEAFAVYRYHAVFTGAVLAAVLAAHGDIRGILFDQPHVIANADVVLRAACCVLLSC